MKVFTHAGQRCTITATDLVFEPEARGALDGDWGCPLGDYVEGSHYAEYLHAHFPPEMVAEIERHLHAAAALARPSRPPPATAPPPAPSPSAPPATRHAALDG